MASLRRRRVFAFLGLGAALLLALLAFGLFPEEPLRWRVEARLRALLGPGARIGRLSVEPGRLRARIEGLVLEGPTYRLDVDHLELRLAAATLRGRVVHLRELKARGVRLVLHPDPASAPARPGAVGPSPPPLWIDALAVEDASVRYRDPSLNGDVVLDGVSLHGAIGAGTLELAARGGRWERQPEVPLGPVHARLRLDPALVTQVEAFEGGLPRSRVRASGALGSLLDPTPDLRVQAALELDELEPLGAPAGMHGHVDLAGTVRGGQELHLSATASAKALLVQGWPLDAAQVKIDHDSSGTSASFEAALLGGRAQGAGRWDGGRVESHVQLAGISLARLRQAGLLETEGVEGRLDAGLELKGPRERAQLEAHAEADGRVPGGPSGEGRAQASGTLSLSDGRMDLAWKASLDAQAESRRLRHGHLDLHGMARGPWPPRIEGEAGGTMEVVAGERALTLAPAASMRFENGGYALEGRIDGLGAPVQLSLAGRGDTLQRLSLAADGLDLETLVPDARGRVRVTASASGRVAALDGTAALQVTEAAWRGTVLGTADAELTLRRGHIEASLALPEQRTRATLALPAGAFPVLTGTVDLEATPLAPFAPWLPPAAADLTGELSGRVTLSVPIEAPDRLRAQAEVSRLDVTRGRWSARASAPFRLAYAPGEASVEGLRLEGPGVRIEADGRAGTGPQAVLDLRLRAHTALGEVPVPEGWHVSGDAEADLAFTGTVRRPQARGQVSLRSATLRAPGVPALSIAEGRLEMEGEAVVLPALTAGLAGGHLTLSGRIPLAAVLPAARRDRGRPAPEEEAAVTLEWSDIDPAALLAEVSPGRGVGLEARLAGRAELRGGLASLAEPSVVVQLPLTQARFQDLPLTLEAATLELRGGRVSTQGLRLTTESGLVEVAGQVDLVRRQAALTGQGQLSLRALSPLLREAALTGTAELDLEARGPFDALHMEGALAVSDASVRLRTIPQPLTGLSGMVVFEGGRLQIERAQGSLGGGPVSLSGTARLVGGGLEDARFTLTGRELAVRYPVGLRTRLNADLTLTGRSGALLLAGNVRARRGVYDLDEALQDSVEASAPSPSPVLRSIALDLTVSTEAPISVRGSIGQFRATGRLALRGDMETPSPIGTLEIERDGKVFLLGKEFQIAHGRLTYNGTWDPGVNVSAEQDIDDKNKAGRSDRGRQVKVTVSLEGTLAKPAVILGSDAGYTQPEIVSLVAVEDSTDRAAQTALGTEAASFFLGGRLSRGLRRLGFDEVSIQPQLVSRDDRAEAGARVTFAKRLSSQVRVIYSASLQGPEDRLVSVEATPTRSVTLSARRADDGNVGAGVGQKFRWGGPPSTSGGGGGRGRARLRDVRLTSSEPLDAEELRRLLKAKEGDRRTIWQLQDDADRLRETLIERGYLEAEVDVRLEEGAAVFQVRSGPRYTWEVVGMADAPDLGREIRQALFEEEALEKGRERLLRTLRERGHLRAKVATQVRTVAEGRGLLFVVDAGPRLEATLRFPGATAFSEGKLAQIAGGPGRLLGEPDEARADLEAAYRARHYLTARIDPPRVTEGAGSVAIEVPVHEGPPAQVAAILFEGVTRPADELRQRVSVRTGRPYDEAAVLSATDALRAHYFGLGFPAVRVSARAVPRGGDVDLVFEIAEGRPARVGSVVVEGATRTRLGFVKSRIRLKPGDPVDPRALSELERRLLDLGVFSRVAVSVSADDPAKVTVTVEEGERVAAEYLLRYEEETDVDEVVRGKMRGELDAELRNLFGRGLRLGGRYGRGPDVEDVRSDLHLPSFLGQDGINLSASRRVQELPGVPGEPQNQLTQRGLHLQSQLQVAARWQMLYGYRFQRSEQEAADFVIVTDVGAIDLSAVNDTRDNRLDARQGRFFTLSLEYSPPVLGKLSGNFNLVKGTAQLFLARPLTESLTWAHGYRLGVAHGFKGQPVPFFERFKAGGGNSVRGFATDSLGPLDAKGTQAAGGKSFAVVNQELRYHHARTGLGAVAFYDAGNVFETRPSLDLRHSAGFGLRWDSPVGLLRVDLGFPLKARAEPREKAYQIFLSVGQAF